MFDDWALIESSFATQYGIRLEREFDMSWTEFFNLLSGLTHETPLGLIVSIRAESDKERLKGFNKDQMKIRSEWRRKIDTKMVSTMTVESKKKATEEFQSILKSMFSS